MRHIAPRALSDSLWGQFHFKLFTSTCTTGTNSFLFLQSWDHLYPLFSQLALSIILFLYYWCHLIFGPCTTDVICTSSWHHWRQQYFILAPLAPFALVYFHCWRHLQFATSTNGATCISISAPLAPAIVYICNTGATCYSICAPWRRLQFYICTTDATYHSISAPPASPLFLYPHLYIPVQTTVATCTALPKLVVNYRFPVSVMSHLVKLS